MNPCEPSPCGANAICQQRDNAGAYICMTDQGNPYEGCQPECVLSTDCLQTKLVFATNARVFAQMYAVSERSTQ